MVRTVGWDVGGAHLKCAWVENGRVLGAAQRPCPLWLGLDRLETALAELHPGGGQAARHAVTMTGELADIFASRIEGVARLADFMAARLGPAEVRIYGGRAGFLVPAQAAAQAIDVASANWHASAELLARGRDEALFVDIGSTTTDLVPIAAGRIAAVGYTDAERLAAGELVYSGATRTPVIAIADQAPFAGRRQPLMAELFATAADVHRLTGALPHDADQQPSADGRDKGLQASRARLARMLGLDGDDDAPEAWSELAAYLAERQLASLYEAASLVSSRGVPGRRAPLVGAGVGRFLVERLAARLERPYQDFGAVLDAAPESREVAARCAPAVAVALLAQ